MFCGPSSMRELNPSKSTGPDNLHPKLLKELATVITEPLVYVYIYATFLENEDLKILIEKQFGFLKERSAEIQLLCSTDDWKKNIDKGFQIDLIYLDLKKAFFQKCRET
ncbi:hypothetical protein QYM36_005350 [Artemia franciscana]|uniref:Uncharacterized protein n=1 Tax=Artemia franciscana TaxID=6661 RepID=A0AA88I464_ARTSF|nr:hypothetical protein QYM36_005350 [Artemia franciscana]